MTDPITDMLNRIRNAQSVFKRTAVIPFSNLKFQISKILENEGFIEKAEKKGRRQKRIIEIWLKYQKSDSEAAGEAKKGVITGLKRISRPGQRIYSPSKGVRKMKNGYGIAIISTSKGVMTDKEARKHNLGGEVLFEIW